MHNANSILPKIKWKVKEKEDNKVDIKVYKSKKTGNVKAKITNYKPKINQHNVDKVNRELIWQEKNNPGFIEDPCPIYNIDCEEVSKEEFMEFYGPGGRGFNVPAEGGTLRPRRMAEKDDGFLDSIQEITFSDGTVKKMTMEEFKKMVEKGEF
jgi:hypothetical protein